MNNDDRKIDQSPSSELTLVVKRARIRITSGLKTGGTTVRCNGISDPTVGPNGGNTNTDTTWKFGGTQNAPTCNGTA